MRKKRQECRRSLKKHSIFRTKNLLVSAKRKDGEGAEEGAEFLWKKPAVRIGAARPGDPRPRVTKKQRDRSLNPDLRRQWFLPWRRGRDLHFQLDDATTLDHAKQDDDDGGYQ
jgi:hypothetical protein